MINRHPAFIAGSGWRKEMETADWIQVSIGAIALLGLFRPEINELINRFRNRVEFHALPKIEISFAEYGPSISVEGNFVSVNKNCLIKNVRAKVINLEDKSEHEMDWVAFRSSNLRRQFYQHDLNKLDIDVATSFWLDSDKDTFKNIYFADKKTIEKCRNRFVQFQNKFLDFSKDKPLPVSEEERVNLMEEFKKTNQELFTEFFTDIGEKIYWKEGEYKLEIEINTKFPTKKIKYTTNFILNVNDKETLGYNVFYLEGLACGVRSVTHIVQKEIEEFSEIK